MGLAGDDPFRYCIYCRADCYAEDPAHTSDCPVTTGVRPVRAEDQILCPHCGKDVHGPALCSDCGSPLNVGDHYILRDIDSHELVARPDGDSITESLCVGCAAREGLLSDQGAGADYA